MKRNFYRVYHVLTAILIALGILHINRYLSALGSITVLVRMLTMKEQHSGLTIRFKIMQELIIVSAVLILGALFLQESTYLVFAAIFLIVLFFEWKFHSASNRWEQ